MHKAAKIDIKGRPMRPLGLLHLQAVNDRIATRSLLYLQYLDWQRTEGEGRQGRQGSALRRSRRMQRCHWRKAGPRRQLPPRHGEG
jgi:hypothetical protein